MRVLVTGGAGYIGSISARHLLEAGHEVVVLDSLERGHRAAVDPRATLVVASVGDRDVLDSVLPDMDAVLHLAGYIDVAESQVNPDLYYRKNLAEPSMMLDRMTSCGVDSLVFSSTAAVYGQPDITPITEEAPRKPLSAYGASKLAFERMIELAESAGLIRATRLRYFNVAGAWSDGSMGEAHPKETHIVPLLLEAARTPGARFSLYGDDYATRDGSCVRDYIHVMDLAEAHLKALEYLQSGGASAVCNLGSGRGYSNLEVARECAEVTGRTIPIECRPRRDGDPAQLIASNERAAETLGWAPTRDLRTMVADAWRWHESHPVGYANGGARR